MNGIRQLQERFPNSEADVRKLARQLFYRECAAVVVLCSYILFIWEKEWYVFLLAIFAVYLAIKTVQSSFFEKLDLEYLEDLEQFINTFRFSYQKIRRIEDALEDAMEQAKPQMMLQGEWMLVSYQKREEVKSFHGLSGIFLLLLRIQDRYGDERTESYAEFLKNLSFVKELIGKELLKKKKIQYAFIGLLPTVFGAFIAMKPLEAWAVYNVENLEAYYNGNMGKLFTFLATGIILIIWDLLLWLRYGKNNRKWKKNRGIWEDISDIPFALALYKKVVNQGYSWIHRLYRMLFYTGYEGTMREFLLKQGIGIAVGISCGFCIVGLFFTHSMLLKMGIILFCGIIGLFAPYFEIISLFYGLNIRKEEEIIRYLTVLTAVRKEKSISVETALEWMSETGEYFKETIDGALGRIEARGEKIFLSMEEEVDNSSFQHILELFRSCDQIPIEEALKDVETERAYYFEKVNTEQKKLAGNAGVLAQHLAFLPAFLVVAVKLILPFILEGLTLLQMYSGGLQGYF